MKKAENAENAYRCGYCRARLPFATDDTLRHVVRHLGESPYLAAFHRYLERRGYDELSAHLLTLRAATRLAHRPA